MTSYLNKTFLRLDHYVYQTKNDIVSFMTLNNGLEGWITESSLFFAIIDCNFVIHKWIIFILTLILNLMTLTVNVWLINVWLICHYFVHYVRIWFSNYTKQDLLSNKQTKTLNILDISWLLIDLDHQGQT
jgi:hypothetical protein